MVKELVCKAGNADVGSAPGLERSPGGDGTLARKSLWQRSLAGYSPWGRVESNTTKATALRHSLFIPVRLLGKIDQDEPGFLCR